jgi:hypothetical protein
MGRTFALFFLFATLLLTASAGGAADPTSDTKAFDKAVTDSLRDVHNHGADLYNQASDYTGAFRVYEGALKAVRPLLGHHPAIQKTIDTGLAGATAEADPARKAFLLHETIEKVRAELKGGGGAAVKPAEPKKVVEANPVAPKPQPKVEIKPKAGLTGTVTYRGKPLAGGTVTLVSTDQKEPRVFGAVIKDGRIELKDVPDGNYIATISWQKDGKELLPAKYATTDTSGLRIEVKAGSSNFDFRLE